MTYRTTLHVEAPVEEVFALFADPANFTRGAAPGVQFGEVHRTAKGIGTHYQWSATVAGLTLSGFDVFTEFVPGHRITDMSSSSLEGTWTYVFEPEGSGTRLSVENQVRSAWRLPGLEQLLDRVTARTHGPVFERVKALLEE